MHLARPGSTMPEPVAIDGTSAGVVTVGLAIVS